jgi:hypothetical protein
MTKFNKILIKHALIDYALVIPKKIENHSRELDNTDYHNLNKIRESILSESNRKNNKHIAIKILIAAAITISIMTTLIACVKPLRNFFIEIFDIAIDINGFENTEIPNKTSIEEVYIPNFINEHFMLAMEDYNESNTTLVWLTDDAYIMFQQLLNDGTNISIDKNENTSYGYKTLNNIEIFFTCTDGAININWNQHGYLFHISCPDSLSWEWIEEAITSLEIVDVPIEPIQ